MEREQDRATKQGVNCMAYCIFAAQYGLLLGSIANKQNTSIETTYGTSGIYEVKKTS